MQMLRYTKQPTEKTGLWQLPIVSSVFKINKFTHPKINPQPTFAKSSISRLYGLMKWFFYANIFTLKYKNEQPLPSFILFYNISFKAVSDG